MSAGRDNPVTALRGPAPAAGPPWGSKRRRSGAEPGRAPIGTVGSRRSARFHRSGGAFARGDDAEQPLLARDDVPDQTVGRGEGSVSFPPAGCRKRARAVRAGGRRSCASCDVGARRRVGRSERSEDGGDDAGPMGCSSNPRVPGTSSTAVGMEDERWEGTSSRPLEVVGGSLARPGPGAWSPCGDLEGSLPGWLQMDYAVPAYLGRARGRGKRPLGRVFHAARSERATGCGGCPIPRRRRAGVLPGSSEGAVWPRRLGRSPGGARGPTAPPTLEARGPPERARGPSR